MNLVDMPSNLSRELCEEAIARYSALVRNRAVGVHRAAALEYPGLSGAELLVVTDHVGVDNRYFFSALQRLPQRYHAAFAHEPFILPAWSLRVMRHTPYAAPPLVTGRDVLRPYTPYDEPDEGWCRTLESYCALAVFARQVRETKVLSGRKTVAAARVLRALIPAVSRIVPSPWSNAYAERLDALFRQFFQGSGGVAEQVQSAWTLFDRAFEQFEGSLAECLGARSPQAALSIAQSYLVGEEPCEYFDREYAFRRAREIDGYHQELASLGFPYGDLFFADAYPHAVHVQEAKVPMLDTLICNVYRVRRRLTESGWPSVRSRYSG